MRSRINLRASSLPGFKAEDNQAAVGCMEKLGVGAFRSYACDAEGSSTGAARKGVRAALASKCRNQSGVDGRRDTAPC